MAETGRCGQDSIVNECNKSKLARFVAVAEHKTKTGNLQSKLLETAAPRSFCNTSELIARILISMSVHYDQALSTVIAFRWRNTSLMCECRAVFHTLPVARA